MAQLLHSAVAARLTRISDVADDLSRELFRRNVARNVAPQGDAVLEMVAFIKREADAALSALKKPPRGIQ